MRIGLNLWGWGGGVEAPGDPCDWVVPKVLSSTDISIDDHVLNLLLSLDQIPDFLVKPWLP